MDLTNGGESMIDNPTEAAAAAGGAATGVGAVWWLARALFGSVIGDLKTRDRETAARLDAITQRLDRFERRQSFLEGRLLQSQPSAGDA